MHMMSCQILVSLSVCIVCVSTQQLCSLCLSGPKVKRWKCPTPITAVTGAASPWSRPHPPTPAEMPTQSQELLSNPSLSPLILLDKVSTEHLNTLTHTHTRWEGTLLQQCNYRGEQLVCSVNICHFFSAESCTVVLDCGLSWPQACWWFFSVFVCRITFDPCKTDVSDQQLMRRHFPLIALVTVEMFVPVTFSEKLSQHHQLVSQHIPNYSTLKPQQWTWHDKYVELLSAPVSVK